MDYQRLKRDLLALGLLAVTVFVALCLGSFDPADPPSTAVYPQRTEVLNLCGPAGAKLAYGMRETVGLAVWLLLVAMVVADIRLFSRTSTPDPCIRTAGWGMVLAAVCMALHLATPLLRTGPVVGSGGYLGAWGSLALTQHFSIAGSLIVIGTLFIVGMVLATELLIVRVMQRSVRAAGVAIAGPRFIVSQLTSRLPHRPSHGADTPCSPGELDDDETVEDEDDDEIEFEPVEGRFKVNPPVRLNFGNQANVGRLGGGSHLPDDTEYELPGLDLLEEAEDFPFEMLAAKAQVAAETLEQTFAEFGLNVKVNEIDPGPVVTQFELILEPGLRVSKVVNLADDLAIALRVPAVRVVSPIPGKNTVGVEVPNEKRVMVKMRELIEAGGADLEKMRVPIFLGKDVSGRPLAVDMTQMPHLLIAGRTGTGKSVCLNTLILSMLLTRTPEDVRMLMIDPKMVELSPYKRIPHLMHPVITDMKKAEAVLAWAVDKMEERYDLLAQVGVRHLDSYNKLDRETILERMGIDADDPEADTIPERMPYIVIVADEMADMMMTCGKDVEGHIMRLAQKSRAVGIHLVLATQKPTVDVITGIIKSNLPARISFQVASKTDSRVVLDENGAERLLGSGDMLYLAPGTSNLTRAQGTFVSDEEVHSVIDFFSQYEPQYSEELAQLGKAGGETAGIDAIRDRDELYEEAIDVVVREQRGSVSLLQRALGVGYGRGARMIDYMAEDGIVGDYNGSKCREVLYTPEQWESLRSGAELEPVEV